MKKQILTILTLVVVLSSCNTEEPIEQERPKFDKKVIFSLSGSDYNNSLYDSLQITIYLAAGHRHRDSIDSNPKWDTLLEKIPARMIFNELEKINYTFEVEFEDVSVDDMIFYGANVQYIWYGQPYQTDYSYEQLGVNAEYEEFSHRVSY